MASYTPVIMNLGTNAHEPIASADLITLSAAQIADLQAQLGVADDQDASQVPVTPAILGQNNVQSALASIAALAATDNTISSIAYNAGTGVLTITDSAAATFTVTITDVEVATVAAPASVTGTAVSTVRYGGANAHMGEPVSWFLINGLKVPAYAV